MVTSNQVFNTISGAGVTVGALANAAIADDPFPPKPGAPIHPPALMVPADDNSRSGPQLAIPEHSSPSAAGKFYSAPLPSAVQRPAFRMPVTAEEPDAAVQPKLDAPGSLKVESEKVPVELDIASARASYARTRDFYNQQLFCDAQRFNLLPRGQEIYTLTANILKNLKLHKPHRETIDRYTLQDGGKASSTNVAKYIAFAIEAQSLAKAYGLDLNDYSDNPMFAYRAVLNDILVSTGQRRPEPTQVAPSPLEEALPLDQLEQGLPPALRKPDNGGYGPWQKVMPREKTPADKKTPAVDGSAPSPKKVHPQSIFSNGPKVAGGRNYGQRQMRNNDFAHQARRG